MISGIGTDLCSIERIARAIENPRFLNRIYTIAERNRLENLCDARKHERAAGIFAAKEAISKALGTGFVGFGFSDIEILTDEKGKPIAQLRGGAAELADNAHIHLSISHENGMAIAFAILETKGGD